MAVQYPESEARIAGMFDRVAPRYDFLNALLSARQDRRWRRRMIARVPYRPGGRLLDMATGTGDVLLAAAQARGEYAELYGGDISTEMLALAAAKAKERGLSSRLVLRAMSATKIPLPDQSCDCVTIAFGLRNVVDRGKALDEFARVLKPGGVLLILEFFVPQRGLLASLFQFYFHKILPFIGGLFSDREAYRYLPESVGSFYAPEALRIALYDRGMTVDTVENFLFGACRLFVATRM